MSELRPCPFCGETDREAGRVMRQLYVAGTFDGFVFVHCNNCSATGPLIEGDVNADGEAAIKGWNNREERQRHE